MTAIEKMEDKVYRKLAEHLDKLPGGFRPSETGADIRLLKGLFTLQEAEYATHLTLERENAQTIAKKINLPVDKTKKILEEMSQKGLIFSIQSNEGIILYQAAPWVIGIYEFQVNRLDNQFRKNYDDYYSSRVKQTSPDIIPQLRTIPINQNIDTKLEVLPYEQVEQLVKAHNQFAVAPCICRQHAKLNGRGCDALAESCLIFGDFADYYVRTGLGRSIEQSEVFEILEKANKDNLVLNPTNSKYVSSICCCCGDCCGILVGLKYHQKPAEAVASSFIAEFDSDSCLNCGVCLDRCQMQAITAGIDSVSFNADRCIGCGLCVSTCPSNALRLSRKPENNVSVPPATLTDTWYTIAREQAKQ